MQEKEAKELGNSKGAGKAEQKRCNWKKRKKKKEKKREQIDVTVVCTISYLC